LVQEVVYYDDRILSIDVDPIEATPSDDRRLVVDAFARYRIADVNRFRERVGTGGVLAAEGSLDKIMRDELRGILGKVSSNEILSSDRAALMQQILIGARAKALEIGIDVVDVRLKRTDLPRQNLDATFARMRAEREREAADEIARGNVFVRRPTERRLKSYQKPTVKQRLFAVKQMRHVTQSLPKPMVPIQNSLISIGH
jgi:membrane protease subunit HflC